MFSIIIPIYESASTITELHQRLAAVAASVDEELEFVFVDDASPDDSWRMVRELSETDDRVMAVRLVRNVRQARAMFAGMSIANGDRFILMDADLAHPPEFIPTLIELSRQGHDFVVTVNDSLASGNWMMLSK